MKKLRGYCMILAIVFHRPIIIANTLEITNLTSGQVTIDLQTSAENIHQTVPANLNPVLNDVNEPNPQPTSISFANNPIQKIVITRFSPNMVQTIYYDHQNTFDAQQIPGGVHNLDITGQGKMLVWKDYVELNNVAYPLTDLQSYVTRCNNLQVNISVSNLDVTQKQLDDLVATVQSVRESDFGAQLAMQLTTIQTSLDALTNTIKTLKIIVMNMQTVQDLQNNLSLGNNNLLGTNKPYQPADDSVERTEKTLNELKRGSQSILQSHPTGIIFDQVQALQGAIDNLQNILNQTKTLKMAMNFEMMVPPATNLQTHQNT